MIHLNGLLFIELMRNGVWVCAGFFLFLLYKRTDRYLIWSRAHNNYIKPSKWHTKNANYGLKMKKKTTDSSALRAWIVVCVCTHSLALCGDMWKCVPLMHLFSNKPEACFIISYFMSLIRIIARKSDSFLLNFNKLIGKTHDWYSI